VLIDNASEPPIEAGANIHLVRAERRLSAGAARNLGLTVVTTPYVVFLDADDLLVPGVLRFLVERISSDPELSAVASGVVEESGTRHRWPPRWSTSLASRRRLFALAHSVWSLFPTTGPTILRTEHVRDAGGYANANAGEDWVLGVSMVWRGRVELHERPGLVYRRLGDSLWEQRRSPKDLMTHAAAVRRRLRCDRGVPLLARTLAPLLVVPQAVVLLCLAPAARLARRLITPET